MAADLTKLLDTAEAGFAAQNAELQTQTARQARSVTTQTATGSGDIDETISLEKRFRLVFVRCHFTGNAGTAAFAISVDSDSGSAYDTGLFTVTQAGKDSDVNLRITGLDTQEPSPWTFQAGDKVRIEWTNPDSGNITWGLEVGLALAS